MPARLRNFSVVCCVALLLALAAAVGVSLARPDAARRFDVFMADTYTRLLARLGEERRLVIVDVDERSLARIGGWPWPRDVFADLLGQLTDRYGVSVLALDMVFPDPRPGDAQLAPWLRRPEVIGAAVFDAADSRETGRLSAPAWPVTGPALPAPAAGYLSNHAGLAPARVGHINPVIDEDGAVRRIQALVCRPAGQCYPTLTLASYLALADGAALTLAAGGGPFAPAWWLSVRDRQGGVLLRVPLAEDFTLRVPYRHRRDAWTSVPAADVLQGRVDRGLLDGSAVLLGGTAFGLADVISTPLHSVAAGLEPHAEVMSALLDGQDAFLYAPRGALAIVVGWLLPWAAALVWLLGRAAHSLRRVLVPLLWLLVFLPASAGVGALVWTAPGWVLPATPVAVFGLLAFALSTSLALSQSARSGRGLFAQFSAYLPARLVTQLSADTEVDGGIQAQRRELTVMFVDIRDFGALSETLDPDQIAELLQAFFTEVGEAVHAHGGIVDKYIGDAVMALWNAVEQDDRHPARALAAAREVVARAEAFAAGPWGEGGLRIGVGVETGSVLVGHFGPVQRRTFTALGDTVVLASRYEEMTRELGRPAIVGAGTAARVPPGELLALGEHPVRGRSRPAPLYTLVMH